MFVIVHVESSIEILVMSGITEVRQKSISESKYIKLNNVEFMENGMKRSWDYVTVWR